jgi:hypothetical protein
MRLAILCSTIFIFTIGCSPTGQQTTTQGGSTIKVVGRDIQPGVWRTRTPSSSCYWERLSSLSGDDSATIENDIGNGPMIVDIGKSDKGFKTQNCGKWTQNLSAITTNQDASFQDGTFIVGTDISAGTWEADSPKTCYWERLSGFSGGGGDTIANDNYSGIVEIQSSDVGFVSKSCGTWTKVNY